MNKMIIADTEIYGLKRAMESAGLPKSDGKTITVPTCIDKLGKAPAGSGHDCFLKGIVVQSRITADHSFWMQWQRYHFHDIVSSTSKMHTILSADVQFEKGTSQRMIDLWSELRDECVQNNSPDNFHDLIMSTPMGMLLTADTTTNYLQLKTIYSQRKTHKMPAWREFCRWIESLPAFLDLTQKN